MASSQRTGEPRPASDIAEAVWKRFLLLDARITGHLKTWGILLIRISLGIVFLWFGSLKILDVSPVSNLVSRTVYWVDAGWFVPVLGVVEVLIGFALLSGRGLRFVLPLFAAQMLGTFLVFVTQPGESFQDGNPLLLTTTGEFVLKNLVLIAAAMVVGGKLRERRVP